MTWTEPPPLSDPFWTTDDGREVSQAHLDADADHAVDPAPSADGQPDNCRCGLACTSNGKLHGFDY